MLPSLVCFLSPIRYVFALKEKAVGYRNGRLAWQEQATVQCPPRTAQGQSCTTWAAAASEMLQMPAVICAS